jgi:hypothetical protein
MSVFGLSHIDIPVTSLERTEHLLTHLCGFWVKRRGEGWVDIDTGTCALRLFKTQKVEQRVTLRLQVRDVAGMVKSLRGAGLRLVYEPMRTPEQELMAQLADADGHLLIVWRELSEDEYEQIPELPKELSWQPEAEELLKSLLKSVPALFRALARWRVAKNAELLAAATRVVSRENVIRSFILSSAKVTRSRVRQPLIDHGVNLDDYAVDFAAEERL